MLYLYNTFSKYSREKFFIYKLVWFSGLFDVRMIEQTAAQIFAAKPLVGQYGNYSLMIQAQDRGFPPNSVTSQINICVSDFNDHAPQFVSPSVNLTIHIPEVSLLDLCNFSHIVYMSKYYDMSV